MLQVWKLNNKIVINEILGLIEICDRCPCEYYLEDLKLIIENGNLGTPEIIEIDLTLGVLSSTDLKLFYLGTEYDVVLEMTADGPEILCGPNVQELNFDFKLILDGSPGEFEDESLVTNVPADNINCITPNQISRIPYEGTVERHTALVSGCQCQCLDDFAFEGVYNLVTTTPTDPDVPEPLSFVIEVQDPVGPEDPVDPDTTEIRFKVFYCYTRCPAQEEEEEEEEE
jgi:hypothetical protein